MSWRWHRTVHTALVNCGPLFDVMRAGVVKRATQPPMTVFAQAWAEVETIGMASIHMEDLSSTGRRCMYISCEVSSRLWMASNSIRTESRASCSGGERRASCSGDECRASCSGDECRASCLGDECRASCSGDECRVSCSGDERRASCSGVECRASCSGGEQEQAAPAMRGGHQRAGGPCQCII